jgi:hypothetical protein
MRSSSVGFGERLRELSREAGLPAEEVPEILQEIAGILSEEADRRSLEDLDEVPVDPGAIREELIRMGRDPKTLTRRRVAILIEFLLRESRIGPEEGH